MGSASEGTQCKVGIAPPNSHAEDGADFLAHKFAFRVEGVGGSVGGKLGTLDRGDADYR